MNGISFFVHGLPQRHRRRAVLRRGTIASYQDKASADWKQTVLLQALPHKPPVPSEAPLSVALDFYLVRPKSLPKRVRAHTRKPDAENLLKNSLDALTGVVWRDDAQIIRLVVTKQYGDVPGLRVAVEEVDL